MYRVLSSKNLLSLFQLKMFAAKLFLIVLQADAGDPLFEISNESQSLSAIPNGTKFKSLIFMPELPDQDFVCYEGQLVSRGGHQAEVIRGNREEA